ncbi:hypothetical protein L9F63_004501, partial [Diploptera punctata]
RCQNVWTTKVDSSSTCGNKVAVFTTDDELYFRPQEEMKWKMRYRDKRTWPLDERRLRHAAYTNNVDLVAALLDSGVNPNACDEAYRSPLLIAACRGYSQVVRLLLEKGADPNCQDIDGNNALHLAAYTNNIRIVTMLLNAGTNQRSYDYYARGPLDVALLKFELLQREVTNEDSNLAKKEALQVIQVMFVSLQKQGQIINAKLLDALSSCLALHNTRVVGTGVTDLLTILESLSL